MMSAEPVETPVDTEDTEPEVHTTLVRKGKAVPLKRTPAQAKKIAADALGAAAAEAAEAAQTEAQAAAARLAQIVNLHIAGYSFSAIGAAIGASAEEVDRMLSTDAARYVRSQPQLRVFVRNWVSERYTKLLEAVWDEATDKNHREKLENQDRALRILDKMERLHGASAPTQSEVTVDAAPDAVEKLVASLASAQGLGYDVNIFDTVAETIPGEVVHQAVADSHQRTAIASAAVEEPQPGDEQPLRDRELHR